MSPEGTKPGDESPEPRIGLFEGYGVEIEYMLVDRHSLDVRPVADVLLEGAVAHAERGGPAGAPVSETERGAPFSEVDRGALAWSNELVLHVLEVKTNGPAPTLSGVAELFHSSVLDADRLLRALGCGLLPGGAHPWMDPFTETRIWPHEYTEVYQAYDRIFSCRGHGWANLQSTHLNLPFQGDREFAALHAAVRLALPLLPALAASSPFLDAQVGTALDRRLMAYRENSRRVPEVTGHVIPEAVATQAGYRETILGAIYRGLAPFDPEGILRHEWANARGAIARFDRGAIEIRILDSQECASADLAVVAAVVELVRGLTLRALDEPGALDGFDTLRLAGHLDATIEAGDDALIGDPEYLRALGVLEPGHGMRAGDAWEAVIEGIGTAPGEPVHEWAEPLSRILRDGPLARRILLATGPSPTREVLREVYGELGACLLANRSFDPGRG